MKDEAKSANHPPRDRALSTQRQKASLVEYVMYVIDPRLTGHPRPVTIIIYGNAEQKKSLKRKLDSKQSNGAVAR